MLTAPCLSTGDLVITGDDLREPWRYYRDERLDNYVWHGATGKFTNAYVDRALGRTG